MLTAPSGRTRLLPLLGLSLALGTQACLLGGNSESEEGADDGSGGRNPAGSVGQTGGSGGSAGSGGSGTSGHNPGGQGGTSPDPDGGPGGNPVIPSDPDFDGVDTTVAPAGVPPAGCEGGYDPSAGSLALTLDDQIHAVIVGAVEGRIQANGVPCTDPNGAPVTSAALAKLYIAGTATNDTVIIDHSTGPLGHLLDGDGGIHVALSDGYDALIVRGSRGDDVFWAGATDEGLLMDMNDDQIADLVAEDVDVMTISLGPGHDVYRTAEGGAGAEFATPSIPSSLYGGDGNDIVEGSAARDNIYGGAGDDDLSGRGGNDWFDARTPGDGTDIINGGEGSDTVSYVDRVSAVTVTLCTSSVQAGCGAQDCACAADDGEAGEGDTLVNIESAHGGAGSDTLEGNERDNFFFGHDGADTLVGNDGNDFLYGDFGDDILLGGAGDDFLDGALGHDQINGGPGSADICLIEPGETAEECELY